MNEAFLIHSGASALAVAALVALAGWARIARKTPRLDETRARALLAEDFPDEILEQVWLASDGAGAIAKSGASALLLMRVGDSYAARQIPWVKAIAAGTRDGEVAFTPGDAAAPRLRLNLATWPPKGLAA
ncbi:MAG: hypothetical protein KGO51_17305 [Alphaproteobacteria bacterium]|nr:hypothetical protein [Alphaproteobacteria bacterium]